MSRDDSADRNHSRWENGVKTKTADTKKKKELEQFEALFTRKFECQFRGSAQLPHHHRRFSIIAARTDSPLLFSLPQRGALTHGFSPPAVREAAP